jgi:hypothetical protein
MSFDACSQSRTPQHASLHVPAPSGQPPSKHHADPPYCLHWLPIQKRIQFKLAVLVFKSLLGATPTYLTDDCRLVADANTGLRLLRSADSRTLVVPRSHNTFGDRSFSVAGPRLWNSLPATLRALA